MHYGASLWNTVTPCLFVFVYFLSSVDGKPISFYEYRLYVCDKHKFDYLINSTRHDISIWSRWHATKSGSNRDHWSWQFICVYLWFFIWQSQFFDAYTSPGTDPFTSEPVKNNNKTALCPVVFKSFTVGAHVPAGIFQFMICSRISTITETYRSVRRQSFNWLFQRCLSALRFQFPLQLLSTFVCRLSPQRLQLSVFQLFQISPLPIQPELTLMTIKWSFVLPDEGRAETRHILFLRSNMARRQYYQDHIKQPKDNLYLTPFRLWV